ncbi:hypothetical protein D3C86_1410240 [compost metagenome]
MFRLQTTDRINADETAPADACLVISSVAEHCCRARGQNTGLTGMPIVITSTCIRGDQEDGPPLSLSLSECQHFAKRDHVIVNEHFGLGRVFAKHLQHLS